MNTSPTTRLILGLKKIVDDSNKPSNVSTKLSLAIPMPTSVVTPSTSICVFPESDAELANTTPTVSATNDARKGSV